MAVPPLSPLPPLAMRRLGCLAFYRHAGLELEHLVEQMSDDQFCQFEQATVQIAVHQRGNETPHPFE